MVAILSTPKHVPPSISSIPRRPPSLDFEPVYRTTVEKDPSHETRLSSRCRCLLILLSSLLLLTTVSAAVYYSFHSATLDIRLPLTSHNQSLSIANHRVIGRMKDSNQHFVQISFYAMARFQHPGSEVTAESISVSVYNGIVRVGGVEYGSFSQGEYPFIHSYGDITQIAMLPKVTILEGEIGYKECSSMESSRISLRLYYSILVHKKTMFGNEIKGRIEYSQRYAVCCSCEMNERYIHHY